MNQTSLHHKRGRSHSFDNVDSRYELDSSKTTDNAKLEQIGTLWILAWLAKRCPLGALRAMARQWGEIFGVDQMSHTVLCAAKSLSYSLFNLPILLQCKLESFIDLILGKWMH